MASSLILKELIDILDTNPYAFEDAVRVGVGTFSKAIKRESELKVDKIDKILKKFPNVSRDWLLTGQGDIFASCKISDRPPLNSGNIQPEVEKIADNITEKSSKTTDETLSAGNDSAVDWQPHKTGVFMTIDQMRARAEMDRAHAEILREENERRRTDIWKGLIEQIREGSLSAVKP